jgi:hypothetical protein
LVINQVVYKQAAVSFPLVRIMGKMLYIREGEFHYLEVILIFRVRTFTLEIEEGVLFTKYFQTMTRLIAIIFFSFFMNHSLKGELKYANINNLICQDSSQIKQGYEKKGESVLFGGAIFGIKNVHIWISTSAIGIVENDWWIIGGGLNLFYLKYQTIIDSQTATGIAFGPNGLIGIKIYGKTFLFGEIIYTAGASGLYYAGGIMANPLFSKLAVRLSVFRDFSETISQRSIGVRIELGLSK